MHGRTEQSGLVPVAAVGVSLVYFEGLRVAGDGGSACEPSCWSRRRGQRSGMAGGLSGIRRLLGLRLPHTCLTAFSVNTQLDAEMHTERGGGVKFHYCIHI